MGAAEVHGGVGFFVFACYQHPAQQGEVPVRRWAPTRDHRPRLAVDPQGWDEYWNNHEHGGRILYDCCRLLSQGHHQTERLNYFVHEYFDAGSQILHAGCGSGQVDTDISPYVSITGLDISVNALKLFKKNLEHLEFGCTAVSSIFRFPPLRSTESCHLGVMEHFTETEIGTILREFFRVLKPGGRMVIFWPPEFGANVSVLKGVKWGLENVLGKKGVKIHPDEITRVQSKGHVVGLFEAAGFSVKTYYFGPKDLFTYSVIVVEKPAETAKVAGTGRRSMAVCGVGRGLRRARNYSISPGKRRVDERFDADDGDQELPTSSDGAGTVARN